MGPIEKTLACAREKISKPEAWTKDSNARTKNGLSVTPSSGRAVCWCSAGAIIACNDGPLSLLPAAYYWFNDFVQRATTGGSIEGFNDAPTTTHGMVLKAFDEAIAEAKASQL